MSRFIVVFRLPEWRRYLFGLLALFVGAWATGATGSMLPLALAASAWMMASVPLLRRLLRRARAPVPPRD
jgi:hypothetical protein